MWGHRIGVYAVKLPGLPEHERIRSYEALDAGVYRPLTEEELAEEEIAEFERRRRARRRRPHLAPQKTQAVSGFSPPLHQERFSSQEEQDRERVRALLYALRGSRMYRLMRRLGRWAWLEEGMREILGDE